VRQSFDRGGELVLGVGLKGRRARTPRPPGSNGTGSHVRRVCCRSARLRARRRAADARRASDSDRVAMDGCLIGWNGGEIVGMPPIPVARPTCRVHGFRYTAEPGMAGRPSLTSGASVNDRSRTPRSAPSTPPAGGGDAEPAVFRTGAVAPARDAARGRRLLAPRPSDRDVESPRDACCSSQACVSSRSDHMPALGDEQGLRVQVVQSCFAVAARVPCSLFWASLRTSLSRSLKRRGDDRRSARQVHQNSLQIDLAGRCATPQSAVRTRWSALAGVRGGFGLRPRQRIRRAGSTRQWER
jgi:hypothetical protein